MIKYAIILLDNTSTAFCHADNPYRDSKLIPIGILKEAIFWCMKENLRIQFVYPDYELPQEYNAVIESIDHVDIKHIRKADVTIFNGWEEINLDKFDSNSIVLRLSKKELLDNLDNLHSLLNYNGHVSVVITDAETFSEEDIDVYSQFLSKLAVSIEHLTIKGRMPKLSMITDRLFLSAMNNCNAGDESITIAPNGCFYICPAFFYDGEENSVGSLQNELNIKNAQLYKLSYAPICRICDAFHCRRCIWLNQKMTLEVNTPSHEQCVISHLERNASRDLLNAIRKHGDFLPDTNIGEIDYIDPFDKIIRK